MNLPSKDAEHILMDALINLYNSTAGIKRSKKNVVKYLVEFRKSFSNFDGEKLIESPKIVAESYKKLP